MNLMTSKIGFEKKRLGLDSICTHKRFFNCDGLNLVDMYESSKDIQSGGSFIIQMPYQAERITVACFETLCNIQVYEENIYVFDADNKVVHLETGDPLDFLRSVGKLFIDRLDGQDEIAQSVFSLISYDAVRQFEKKKLDNRVINRKVPDYWAIIPKVIAILNNSTGKGALYLNYYQSDADMEKFNADMEKYLNWSPPQQSRPARKKSESGKCEPFYNVTQEEFCRAVEKAKEYIRSGDIFQVVLSVECSIKTSYSAEEIFRNMLRVNQSTANYLVQTKEFSVIGASPEILVENSGGECIIKPLAGTILYDGIKDAKKERQLLGSEKDCAEHRMLVDLARNDLGRVCRYNTVLPKRLMEIEYYYNVMHIVSEIKGMIDSEKDSYDLLRASFPAGTMAGAPKIRAMEIIDELENTIRGFYSGGVGFFTSAGNLYSYIVIRSLIMIDDTAYARAGSGIVYDSVPSEEYNECLNKLKNALKALS